MANAAQLPLVAVDVGNSRLKLGEFESPLGAPLPHPARALAVSLDWSDEELEKFLQRRPAEYRWVISSVNRGAAQRLVEWLAAHGATEHQLLAHADLPLTVDLPLPGKVGLDRLANAVAVNALRPANQAALIVDMGTAIKVDLVSAQGAFAGGAILPGVSMSARALHEFTDLLPLVKVTETPAPLGRSTIAAISAGLYWGPAGAVRELIARLSGGLALPTFLTGGDAPDYAAVLSEGADPPLAFVPHLTLAGIALARGHAASAAP